MVRVSLEGRLYTVDNITAKAWFPNASSWGTFRGDDLAEEVEDRVSAGSQTGISPHTVRKAIKDLLQTLTRHHYQKPTELIKEALQSLLQDDTQYNSQHSGLKSSRQRFLILASVAHYTDSRPLANAIASFLSENIYEVQRESPYFLREWSIALRELHGLVEDPILQQLVSQLAGRGQNNWRQHKWYDSDATKMVKAIEAAQRWPSPLLLGPAVGTDLRPRSAPGYRCPRYQSPDWRVGHWPRSAWSSPTMPPRISNYYDEDYESLALEQEMQAAEVDDLSRRVKRLEYNSNPYH